MVRGVWLRPAAVRLGLLASPSLASPSLCRTSNSDLRGGFVGASTWGTLFANRFVELRAFRRRVMVEVADKCLYGFQVHLEGPPRESMTFMIDYRHLAGDFTNRCSKQFTYVLLVFGPTNHAQECLLLLVNGFIGWIENSLGFFRKLPPDNTWAIVLTGMVKRIHRERRRRPCYFFLDAAGLGIRRRANRGRRPDGTPFCLRLGASFL